MSSSQVNKLHIYLRGHKNSLFNEYINNTLYHSSTLYIPVAPSSSNSLEIRHQSKKSNFIFKPVICRYFVILPVNCGFARMLLNLSTQKSVIMRGLHRITIECQWDLTLSVAFVWLVFYTKNNTHMNRWHLLNGLIHFHKLRSTGQDQKKKL